MRRIRPTVAAMLAVVLTATGCSGVGLPRGTDVSDIGTQRQRDYFETAFREHVSEGRLTAEQLDALARERFGEITARNDRAIRAFAEAAVSGRGRVALKTTYSTIEGDPIFCYLVADNGRLELVKDARRDKYWGKSSPIRRSVVIDLRFGIFGKDGPLRGTFQPLEGDALKAASPLRVEYRTADDPEPRAF